MKRFNFLERPKFSLRDALMAAELTPALRTAALALAMAIVSFGATIVLEHHRLDAEQSSADLMSFRLAAARHRLSVLASSLADVEDLVRVAAELAGIRRSGSRAAASYAALGARLPARAWLTAVAHGEHALIVRGSARGYQPLAATLTALGPVVGPPTLVSSRVVMDEGSPIVRFELRVDGDRR